MNPKTFDYSKLALPYGATIAEDGVTVTEGGVRLKLTARPSKASFIRIAIGIPSVWNGILIGRGTGGMGGGIAYQDYLMPKGADTALVTTDLGTSRGCESGIHCPDVWKDFGWRATHIMTVLAKLILQKVHGKEPDFAYFIGVSTGGQQALMEAQRFGQDYNGIIAGEPAANRTLLHTYFLWNRLKLSDHGKPLFCAEEIDLLHRYILDYYQCHGDGEPGDNFITAPTNSKAQIAKILGQMEKDRVPFSAAQYNALSQIFNGPVNPVTGRRIYNGMPFGSEKNWCGIATMQEKEFDHLYPFIWAFGKDYDLTTFDFNHDLDTLNTLMAKEVNANSPDLSTFYQNGGKLILYSAACDPCVPFPDALNYYKRVTAHFGSEKTVQSFFRMFLVPGKGHGSDGDGPRAIWSSETQPTLLPALRNWCENGIAPQEATAVFFHNQRPEDGVQPCRTIKPVSPEMFCPETCAEEYLNL